MAQIPLGGIADSDAFGGTRDAGETVRPVYAWVLGTWTVGAMVVVIPALLVWGTPSPSSGTWLIALSVTTISGLRYGWIIADGRRRLHEMTFWVFVYVFLGLAPVVQLRSEQAPATTPRIDPSLNGTAMVVVLVGVVAFVLGMTVTFPSRNLRTRWVLSGDTHLWRSITLALFALTLDVYYLYHVGFQAIFSSRDDLSQSVAGNWAESSMAVMVSAVTSMTLLVAFIALAKCLMRRENREWPLVALTLVVGLALAATVNPFTSARYVFGTAALAVAATFGLFASAKLFRITAILWLAVLILAFPLADAFRYSSTAQFKTRSVSESLTSPDFDAFPQINNTVLYIDNHGITAGRQAAGVLLFWVPRRVWPEKPSDTGILLSESRRYDFSNLSAPIWAEFLINGGWIALGSGMFALGWVVRSRDTAIELSMKRSRSPGIVDSVLPFYMMILLRGSLLQAMSYLVVILCSALFVSKFVRSEA